MTLLRTMALLAGLLVVLLLVVVLRAETTRLHFEISRQERQAEAAFEQLRARELELARLRNPMVLRERVKEAAAALEAEAAAAADDDDAADASDGTRGAATKKSTKGGGKGASKGAAKNGANSGAGADQGRERSGSKSKKPERGRP